MDSAALLEQGHLAYDQGDFQAALKFYTQAPGTRPRLRSCPLQSGQCPDAAQTAQTGPAPLRKRPDSQSSRKTYNNIGLLHKQLQNWEKAVIWFHKTLEVDPAYFRACNNLGNLYASLGEPEQAES